MPSKLAPPFRIRKLSENVQKSLASSLTFTCMHDVVLELIYNALDAEASHIQMEIDFLQFKIIVKDNGQGINQEDLLLLGTPACTSKSIDSLFSRGYRGQALASLVNIGLIEVSSKAAGQSVRCSRLLCREDSGISCVVDPYPPGTKVVCSNLFFNMPVRRGQWQVQAHLDKLRKIVERIAVVHSNVRFQLYDSYRQSELLHIYPTRCLKQSFLQVYSKKHCKIPITSNFQFLVNPDPAVWMTGIRINHLVSRVEWLFLNGRYCNCASLTKSVSEYLEKETSSEGFICHISCSHRIETNVEEFFSANEKVFTSSSSLAAVSSKSRKKKKNLPTLLQEVLPRVRSSTDLKEPLSKLQKTTSEIHRPYVIDPRTGNSRYLNPLPSLPRLSRSLSGGSFEDTPVYPTPPAPISQPVFHQSLSLHKGMLLNMNVLGQIASKFILAIYERYVIIFDQHAADERVLLESLLSSPWQQETPVSAEILVPNHLYYNSFGFTMAGLDSSSNCEFYLETVPNLLSNFAPKKWLDILEQLALTEYDPNSSSPPKPLMDVLCSKACRSAIMFGDPLSLEACEALVRALSKCQFPFQCAHGRPSVIPILALPPTYTERANNIPGLYNWLSSPGIH